MIIIAEMVANIYITTWMFYPVQSSDDTDYQLLLTKKSFDVLVQQPPLVVGYISAYFAD